MYDIIIAHLRNITNPDAILDRGNEPLGKDDLISLANMGYAYARFRRKFLVSLELGSLIVYDMSKFSESEVDILTGDDISNTAIFDDVLLSMTDKHREMVAMQLANLNQ